MKDGRMGEGEGADVGRLRETVRALECVEQMVRSLVLDVRLSGGVVQDPGAVIEDLHAMVDDAGERLVAVAESAMEREIAAARRRAQEVLGPEAPAAAIEEYVIDALSVSDEHDDARRRLVALSEPVARLHALPRPAEVAASAER